MLLHSEILLIDYNNNIEEHNFSINFLPKMIIFQFFTQKKRRMDELSNKFYRKIMFGSFFTVKSDAAIWFEFTDLLIISMLKEILKIGIKFLNFKLKHEMNKKFLDTAMREVFLSQMLHEIMQILFQMEWLYEDYN